jgi:hypothetical protein
MHVEFWCSDTDWRKPSMATVVLRQVYIPEKPCPNRNRATRKKVPFKTMDLRGLVEGQPHLVSV